jgi:hypothetical protein
MGIHSLPSDQIALRINGEKIETSRGAEIPLDVAKGLWCAMEAKIDVTGMTLGNFTVRELTEENLIVGCHTIPLSEINLIAKQLGLTK